MIEILKTYGYILLEFLLELYVFCAFFYIKLDRKDDFRRRMLGGLVGVLILTLPMAWIYNIIGTSVVGRVSVYVVLFILVILHAQLCYQEKLGTIVFCTGMAYAAQNLMYKLFLIFWCYGEQHGFFNSWGNHYNLWYRIVYYGFMGITILILYFTFITRITKKIKYSKLDHSLLALSLIVLVITIFLCSVEDVYFAKLSAGKENIYSLHEYYVLRQAGNSLSAICCAVVLLLASKTISEHELLQEVEYLKHSIKQGQRQYEISKDTIDLINIKVHDIKYKINSVLAEHGDVSKDVMDDLYKSVRIYDANIETGNELLNVFITDKSLYCEQNGINLSCMIDGSKLEFMEAGDLYCLFGNIVDNALESVVQIQDKNKRVINLSVKAVNDMLFIQSDNYYAGELSFKDGLPQTTKEDSNWHGFDLRSIKLIVQKYGGELTTYVEDDIFHLSILFGDISNFGVQNKK